MGTAHPRGARAWAARMGLGMAWACAVVALGASAATITAESHWSLLAEYAPAPTPIGGPADPGMPANPVQQAAGTLVDTDGDDPDAWVGYLTGAGDPGQAAAFGANGGLALLLPGSPASAAVDEPPTGWLLAVPLALALAQRVRQRLSPRDTLSAPPDRS